jgi:hypothetical protein
MIDAARREADRRNLRNVSFRAAPADGMPFDDGSFDAVVSRFGVMFFPELARLEREEIDEIKRAFFAAARAYSGAHGLSLPAEVIVVSARKSGRSHDRE